MGQLLSTQTSPARPQSRKSQDRSRKSRTVVEWQLDTRVDSVQSISSTTRHGWASRHQAIHTVNESPQTSESRHLQDIDGNSRGLNKPHRHRKGKIAREAPSSRNNGPRVGKADQPKAPKKVYQKPRSQVSRSTVNHETNPKKECIICTDTRSLTHFPSRTPTSECEHTNDVCRRCLRTWIQSEFLTKIWNEINCPVCSIRMQHADIQAFAPHNIFRQYDRLNTKAALEADPNFRWCTTKGCRSGQVHPPEHSKFRCKACKKSHCIHHGTAWHRGETCREYDYRENKKLKKQEEVASKRVIAETTKKCPGCKSPIQKNFGCDHMSCSRCRHEFCWLCLAPYRGTGFRKVVKHRSACEYYEPDGSDAD